MDNVLPLSFTLTMVDYQDQVLILVVTTVIVTAWCQPEGDLLVVVIGEQRQRHREIHHDVRREPAIGPLRLPARRGDRLINRIPRDRTGKHPQRDVFRRPAAGSHLSILRHKDVIITVSRQTATNDTPTSRVAPGNLTPRLPRNGT